MEYYFESDSDDEQDLLDLKRLSEILKAEELSNEGASALLETQEEYNRIEHAEVLNKLTDDKYRRLEGILTSRLYECRERLKKVQAYRTELDKREKQFRYITCGKPYFKGPDNFVPPDNEDTILMAKSSMWDMSNVTTVRGWTVKDKTQFLLLLHKQSVKLQKEKNASRIAQLKREHKVKPIRGIKNIISKIKEENCALENKSISQIALPIDEEYDWDLIANKTNHRHSAQEYQSLWKLFLHPSVNKSNWSQAEHVNLNRIALNHNRSGWDEIAQELNTGRTAYQCFVYFRTNVANSFTGQKWSKEEEEYLRRLIDYTKENNFIPWSKVASHMENRTKVQVYNKYLRLMELRKGRFLPEEDAVILTCIKDFGSDFRRIMKYLPGRSNAQIRNRYRVLAQSEATKTSTIWTVAEDKKLLQYMANQDSSFNYSSLTCHFPGKARSHIRTRYMTLSKWMRGHPNTDIENAPRRGARRLRHGKASKDLNKAVEKLKDRMQSEVNHMRSTRITKNSPENDIETALIAAVINAQNKEEQEKQKNSNSDQPETANAMDTDVPPNINQLKQILILLGAKLDKEAFKAQYEEKYPKYSELLVEDTEKYVVIKSYSKKNSVKLVESNTPSIWGDNALSKLQHVLPPNYDTITACKRLMAHVTSKPRNDDNVNLAILAKRNVVLQEQLDLLVDRFKVLFLWPMMLSNEMPNFDNRPPPPAPVFKEKRGVVLPGDPGIAIPAWSTGITNEVIDLDETEETKDIDLTQDFGDVAGCSYKDEPSCSYKDEPSCSYKDEPSCSYRDEPSCSYRDEPSCSYKKL